MSSESASPVQSNVNPDTQASSLNESEPTLGTPTGDNAFGTESSSPDNPEPSSESGMGNPSQHQDAVLQQAIEKTINKQLDAFGKRLQSEIIRAIVPKIAPTVNAAIDNRFKPIQPWMHPFPPPPSFYGSSFGSYPGIPAPSVFSNDVGTSPTQPPVHSEGMHPPSVFSNNSGSIPHPMPPTMGPSQAPSQAPSEVPSDVPPPIPHRPASILSAPTTDASTRTEVGNSSTVQPESQSSHHLSSASPSATNSTVDSVFSSNSITDRSIESTRQELKQLSDKLNKYVVPLSDMTTIENTLSYVLSPDTSVEVDYLNYVKLLESIPSSKRTTIESDQIKKYETSNFPRYNSVTVPTDFISFMREILFFKSSYFIPDRMLKPIILSAVQKTKDTDLIKTVRSAVSQRSLAHKNYVINYLLIFDYSSKFEEQSDINFITDHVIHLIKTEPNDIIFIANLDYAITDQQEIITTSSWIFIWRQLWKHKKYLLQELVNTVNSTTVISTLHQLRLYTADSAKTNSHFRLVNFPNLWRQSVQPLRELARLRDASSTTPKTNTTTTTTTAIKCSCCGARHPTQECRVLKKFVKSGLVNYKDNTFYNSENKPYTLNENEYLVRQYKDIFSRDAQARHRTNDNSN